MLSEASISGCLTLELLDTDFKNPTPAKAGNAVVIFSHHKAHDGAVNSTGVFGTVSLSNSMKVEGLNSVFTLAA